MKRWFVGELVGTFILVFFGCGAVATSVSVGAPVGLFQVAIVWGLGLVVAIYLTGGISGAHLNPAITVAIAVFTSFPARRIPGYFLAQFLGAFLAAAAVYGLYSGYLAQFEEDQGLVRGRAGSEASAMVFGEYYPNPGGKPLVDEKRKAVTGSRAFFAEFLGTALLAVAIFGFTSRHNTDGPKRQAPLAIGLALTTLICVFAPVSMAGFNPARDFGPRLFSSLAGWGSLPFSFNGTGWFTVYIVAPFAGALAGGFLSGQLLWRTSEEP